MIRHPDDVETEKIAVNSLREIRVDPANIPTALLPTTLISTALGQVPFEPVTTDTGTTFTRPFGLILTIEVGRMGVDTYGDLLNSIAASWRGREEVSVRPGHEGGILNEQGAPVGLWLIQNH